MNPKKTNYGFILEPAQKSDYILGSSQLPQEELQLSGNWEQYVPEYEHQSTHRIETNGCVSFGTLNALEAILKRKYSIQPNFSDRYLAYLSGTNGTGNTPRHVIETLRNFTGTVPEVTWPFHTLIANADEYYSSIPFDVKLEGIKWLKDWKVGYEFVYDGDTPDAKERLMQALKYSPVGVAVNAWHKDGELYVSKGVANHWCVLVNYRYNEYWVVFDTYDKGYKKLAWDFHIPQAMRYHIERRKEVDLKFMVRAARGLFGLYV